ncbi:MAG: hypothetical protein OXR68_07410, partial [Alphaproteobacteria bacterium]|nr:hypothetical protein [Alphaproteobacteria bacterium]
MKKQFYKAFISLVSIFQSTTISEMSQEEAQDKEAELLGALRSSSASKKMLSVRSLREKRNLLALSTLAIVLAYGEASFDSKKQHFFGINLHNIEIDHIFW